MVYLILSSTIDQVIQYSIFVGLGLGRCSWYWFWLIRCYDVPVSFLFVHLYPMLSVGQQPTTALFSSSLLVQEGVSFCLEGISLSQQYTMELRDLILQYLLTLCATLVLPTSLWIICSCNIFANMRGFTPDTYQEKVRENLEDTIVERLCQQLNDLFPQYGLTPSGNAPFSTIVRNLLDEVEAPERLNFVSDMYKSLVENGIQSPFFHQLVQAFLAIMGGG